MICKVKGHTPKIDQTAFVHKSAVVTGDVVLGENVGVWPCAVLRGDMDRITIGNCSNVQDNCVLHTDTGLPLVIGESVVIGHNVNLHSCTIGDHSLIGIGAVVLNGAKIGKSCLVGAGSLVTPNKEFPDGSVIMGSPAKVVRQINQDDIDNQQELVDYYMAEAKEYKETEEEL